MVVSFKAAIISPFRRSGATLDRSPTPASGAGPPQPPVEIVAWDPAWPARFADERARLEPVLREWLAGPIEHVGSTAIAGMPAKPVIDLMAPVHGLEASRAAIPAVTAAGYRHAPYREDQMHWFCRPSPARRTHHLYLVPAGSPAWRERLAFRDALRADIALAREYAELKQMLADRWRNDREAYTAGKGPFITRVLAGLRPPAGDRR